MPHPRCQYIKNFEIIEIIYTQDENNDYTLRSHPERVNIPYNQGHQKGEADGILNIRKGI